MELISIFSKILNLINFLLKKIGYKIVPLSDYNEETRQVDQNYARDSSDCQNEKTNGAEFNWSEKYYSGCEKYFEIKENKKIYFKWGEATLWIKRPYDK